MSAIVWSDVTDWDSSLTTGVSVPARTLILSNANGAFNVAEFGGEGDDRLKLVRILFAAHFGVLQKRGSSGATGVIASQSAGGLARSYVTSALAQREFGATVHGQNLLAMFRASPARAPRVV